MNYDGTYPLNSSILIGHTPGFPSAQYYALPCKQNLPMNPTLKVGYWELLFPALFGATGALFVSIFTDSNQLKEVNEGNLLKLAIDSYAIGASVAASYAIIGVFDDSKARHDHLFRPIGGALLSVILLFAADYLLLYRSFPSSFTGDVGNDFWTQLFSFLYLSVTIIPGASVGDIMPNNLTARALVGSEIAFYLFTMATAIQLILARDN